MPATGAVRTLKTASLLRYGSTFAAKGWCYGGRRMRV